MRKEQSPMTPSSELSHQTGETKDTQLPSEPSGEAVESFIMLHPGTGEQMAVNAHLDQRGKIAKLYGYNDKLELIYFEDITHTSVIRLEEILKNIDQETRHRLINQLEV